MEADSNNLVRSVSEYEKLLPKKIHIAIFGLGEDGHIASIFPNSPALSETRKRIMSAVSPKLPSRRMTITARVLKEIGRTFILVADPAS
jgi:6-phosphogluconolactonase